MDPVALSLKTIEDMDFGKVAVAFNHHLGRAVEDCMDRPADKKPRKIILTGELTPQIDQTGDCTDVAVEFKVRSTVPEHRSKTFVCRPRKGGHLLFNPESPESIDQQTLDFKETRE